MYQCLRAEAGPSLKLIRWCKYTSSCFDSTGTQIHFCVQVTCKASLADFPCGSVVNNPPATAGYMSSIPGSRRSPGGRNGNPLQYPCLENPMDRGAWWGYSSWGRKELDTTEQLKNHTFRAQFGIPSSSSQGRIKQGNDYFKEKIP